MFPLVEFPEIVQHYPPLFESVLSADAFIEFQRYISGLIISENKPSMGSTASSLLKAATKVP